MICSKPLATKVPVNKAAGTINLSKNKIKITDDKISNIDEILKSKENEILQI